MTKPAPGPVQPETRTRAIELMAEGKGRNEIARLLGLGAASVTRIAISVGHEFDRSATALAVRARNLDIVDAKQRIAEQMLVRAMEALDLMDAPAVVFHFEPGSTQSEYDDGKLIRTHTTKGAFREHVLDAPTFSDQRNLAVIAATLAQRATDLTRAVDGAGAEEGASVLLKFGAALHAAADALEGVDPTETPDD